MATVTIKAKNGDIALVNVHDSVVCYGRNCIIHNPLTPTEYRNLNWRNDRGIFEEICEHGIGHPVIETPAFIDQTHGCDGCCII